MKGETKSVNVLFMIFSLSLLAFFSFLINAICLFLFSLCLLFCFLLSLNLNSIRLIIPRSQCFQKIYSLISVRLALIKSSLSGEIAMQFNAQNSLHFPCVYLKCPCVQLNHVWVSMHTLPGTHTHTHTLGSHLGTNATIRTGYQRVQLLSFERTGHHKVHGCEDEHQRFCSWEQLVLSSMCTTKVQRSLGDKARNCTFSERSAETSDPGWPCIMSTPQLA